MYLYFVLLRRFMEMKHYSDELQSHTSQLLRARAVSVSLTCLYNPPIHTNKEIDLYAYTFIPRLIKHFLNYFIH